MSTSLIPKILPHFVPNQVLTDTQLNSLRDYLEEHDRWTRTHLVGTGIVCGLHINYKRADGKAASPGSSPQVVLDAELHTVSVTAGYGITSEGYLVAFEENAYTEYREYERTDSEGNVLWDYNADNPIYELVNANTPLPVGYLGRIEPAKNPLREQHIKNHVVVLLLEKARENLKSCLVSDCSNKGVQGAHNCRILLVHVNDLEQINQQKSSLFSRVIHVPRLHKLLGANEENIGFEEVADFNTLRYAYGHALLQLKGALIDSINAIDTEAAEFLNVNWNPSDNPIQKPFNTIFADGQEHNDHNQYHYDFFRELAIASNEFWEAWCRLGKTCDIKQSESFSCHLMLGRIIDEVQPVDETYRNIFVPSAVKDAGHGDWERCRNLLLRLANMIKYFDVSGVETFVALSQMDSVVITPSQTIGHLIAKTAIPFYYDLGDAADPYASALKWQLDDLCEADPILSYHFYGKEKYAKIHSQPLDYDFSDKSFLRIEGHIGKDPILVRDELAQLRKANNLEFDFLFLYLGDELPEDNLELDKLFLFSDFAARCPGMEHTAGVEPGGTFILVIDPLCPDLAGEVVVADFSLSANITKCLVEPVVSPPEPEPEPEPEPNEPECPRIVRASAIVSNYTQSESNARLVVFISGALPDNLSINWGDGTDVQNVDVTDSTITVSHPYQRGLVTVTRTIFVTTRGPENCPDFGQSTTVDIPDSIFSVASSGASGDEIVNTGGTRSMAPREPDTSDVAASRRQAQIATMYSFNESGTYSKNRSYQSALDFVGNESLKANEFSSAFRNVNGKLLSVYKRGNDAKKQEYQAMMEVVTLRYMDQLVQNAPTSLPTDARDSLTQTLENMKKAGISLASLKKAWKASELKKATGAKTVDQINRLLK